MIIVIILVVVSFSSYLLSFLLKPFVAVFYGGKIKEKLLSTQKKDTYYKKKYKESQKHIDSLDKGFLKSLSEIFHESDCTEEEYITKKKKEEKRNLERSYNAELSFYSFGLSFLCILGLVTFGVLKKDSPEIKKPKNPIAEHKAFFKKECEGLNLQTIQADFIKLTNLQEEADMVKKRTKILYKNGHITRFQYQQAKDVRSAIRTQWNNHYSCIEAREDYKRSIAVATIEASQESIENNTNQPEIINTVPPLRQYTNSEIKTACQYCMTYYNCEISRLKNMKWPPQKNAFLTSSCQTNGYTHTKNYDECWNLQRFLNDRFIDSAFDYSPKIHSKYFTVKNCNILSGKEAFDCLNKEKIETFKFQKDLYCGKLTKTFLKNKL